MVLLLGLLPGGFACRLKVHLVRGLFRIQLGGGLEAGDSAFEVALLKGGLAQGIVRVRGIRLQPDGNLQAGARLVEAAPEAQAFGLVRPRLAPRELWSMIASAVVCRSRDQSETRTATRRRQSRSPSEMA